MNTNSIPRRVFVDHERQMRASQQKMMREQLEITLKHLSMIHGELLDALKRETDYHFSERPGSRCTWIGSWCSKSEVKQLRRFRDELAKITGDVGYLSQQKFFWRPEKELYIVRQGVGHGKGVNGERQYLAADLSARRARWYWTDDKAEAFMFEDRQAIYYRVHRLRVPEFNTWMINAVEIEEIKPEQKKTSTLELVAAATA
jgi:hypothetical protein